MCLREERSEQKIYHAAFLEILLDIKWRRPKNAVSSLLHSVILTSRKIWFHHRKIYSPATCSIWQLVVLLGGTPRVGLLCLVFHPGSLIPPQPIKWCIVKETFLEFLTHYSLPTSPFPLPLMHANLSHGYVHIDGWCNTTPFYLSFC